VKPSLSGRADLLRALARHDPALTAAMADLLGYHETPVALYEQTLSSAEPTPRPQIDISISTETQYEPADVPFWRLEAYEAVALEERPPEPSTRTAADPLWRRRPAALPDFTPLAPPRVVLTRLRRVAAIRRATSEIDAEAMVERLSQGNLVDTIPRRQRRAWGSDIYIVEDRARRLVPYWRDQDSVTEVMWHIYPPSGVTVARIEDGDGHPVVRWPKEQYGQLLSPLPGAMVLVLGDLGCLATEGDSLRRFWLRWGRQLHSQQNPAVALVPAQIRDIPPELARTWTIVRWDAASAMLTELSPQSAANAVRRVLTLLAPAVRVEPGLLRAVRCLLPEGRGDPGLEARVWQDAAIASRHSVAATLDSEQRKAYRQRFAAQDESLRRAVLGLLRTWRASLHAAVWFEEVLGLDEHSQRAVINPEDWEDAVTFVTELAGTLHRAGQLPVDTAAWICRVAERLPEAATPVREALHDLFNLVRPHAADAQVPAWFDPAVGSPAGRTVRQVTLWQVADRLLLRSADPSSSADHQPVVRGSPLGFAQTASGEVIIAVEQREQLAADFWQTGQPPAWAQHWDWDTFGPWVTFRVGAVEQRLRWIPPGRFWMGSPETEEGRYDEGPRHEVQLTRGFWLFDTPCTQALWQAVMGTNPSQFQGETRPVEQVSWEDCQTFIGALNAQLPGLDVRLPTEAQWEYACRAGTDTARYHDDVKTIAWYGANSHGETHEVGQKLPNAWGLYDMLGNVLEWCDDGRRDYEQDTMRDPIGPTGADAARVFRGGSWLHSARVVRAAFRIWRAPGIRGAYLGFRCASSSESQPVREEATWRVSKRQAEPAKTVSRRSAARLLDLSRQSSIATGLAEGDGFVVRTDRDRLYFGRITRPSWATEIGRDAYGLLVVLEVDGVRQRMRWIPPGRFWMGSPETEEGRTDWEGPRHEVHLTRGFWLFDTPCTQALWSAVLGANPSAFRSESRPVEQVSWHDCQTFITKLNERFAGLALGLPTEAEWEYACRAGTDTARYHDDVNAIAWYSGKSNRETHEVGQKRPNAWGLYDMLGNVFEWCHDGRRDYEQGTVSDPIGPIRADAHRVIRGGGWIDSARDVRAASRYWYGPGYRDNLLGLRCSSSGQASRLASRKETAGDRSRAGPEASRPTQAGDERRTDEDAVFHHSDSRSTTRHGRIECVSFQAPRRPHGTPVRRRWRQQRVAGCYGLLAGRYF
jgi:formylglycine-generating enzyme required for sulfatase activity